MFQLSSLRVPIIQAPMAGGVNTPRLAAAVVNHGGLGSFGFAYASPERISADLQAARALARGPLNANFFVFEPVALPDPMHCEAALAALRTLGVAAAALALPQAPFVPDLDQQLEPIWQIRPEVLTFHLGIPAPKTIAKAHSLGIAVGLSATCVAEAKQVAAAGADFVVAQGIEAGGHRGIFSVGPADDQLACLDLVRALVGTVPLPIVAAGGIMTTVAIKQALAAGASAVQLGTAFLTCTEAGTSPAHRRYLLEQPERGTALTLAYSGRPARSIVTDFMRQMDGKPILPFPLQNTLTSALRSLATKQDNGEQQSLWAGSQYRFCRDESAGELMLRLSGELTKA